MPAAVGIAILAFFLALPRLPELAAANRAPGRIQTLLTTTTESVRDARDLPFKRDWRIVGAFAYLWCDIAVLAACFAATGHMRGDEALDKPSAPRAGRCRGSDEAHGAPKGARSEPGVGGKTGTCPSESLTGSGPFLGPEVTIRG